MAREILPFGTWPSPISARAVAGKSLRFGTLQADADRVYWLEGRPGEGGRGVIMRAAPGGEAEELLPAPWSARTRVHEYGGGDFLAHGPEVYFVEADSQDVHAFTPGARPRRLTMDPATRFADMTCDEPRDRLIAVAERHGQEDQAPENFLAAVPLKGSAGEAAALLRGRDFYSTPRLGPDGRTLAFLAWDLPHMPWETAALYTVELGEDGTPGEETRIAGGGGSACFQPEWGPDGRLYFVWDRTGWGVLYAWDGNGISQVAARDDGELLRPHWVFGMRAYAVLDEARAACAFIEEGETRLAVVDMDGGETAWIESGLRSVDTLVSFGGGLAAVGASDTAPPAVIGLTLEGEARTIRSAGDTGLEAGDVSKGEMLRFEGESGGLYALYYPPANSSCSAPDGELPPAILLAHGGPTGMADRGLKLKTQYWTSRGFAVCDLDYSGSAGYGRAYRERLDGQWGVRDVEDVAALTRHLCGTGRADPERLLISGGSAGGYTVLMALAVLDAFAAGGCAYAVADLAQLQRITHKFESGYLYGLTGATPETCDAVFSERSPVNRAGDIACPVIFFQGLEDKVVPPAQSRSMAETLRAKGVPVAYREFDGEGHGFRQADTIVTVLESEYAFYARVLGLEPAEKLPDIEIENWRDR